MSGTMPRWRYLPLYLSLELGRRLAPYGGLWGTAGGELSRWRPGISIIIAECGTPVLLRRALASTVTSAARLREVTEIIVVVNGAGADLYQEHRREFPAVRWLHSKKCLGYCGAIAKGLQRARFDWVYLLNSDMTLAESALAEVAEWRMPRVFAISSQVFFADPQRRREETGWTNYSMGADGAFELFDATPEDQSSVRGHLYAGGGNSLFRKDLLGKFLARSHCYGPAYWEDVEWGVRAWRDGFDVLFCPSSHVTHVHRATVSKLFSPAELERIWKRNQLLFALRNGFTPLPNRLLVRSLRGTLDLKTQRELVTLRQAASLFFMLVANARASRRGIDLSQTCRKSYSLPSFPSGPWSTM